jgi:hypothetical protein
MLHCSPPQAAENGEAQPTKPTAKQTARDAALRARDASRTLQALPSQVRSCSRKLCSTVFSVLLCSARSPALLIAHSSPRASSAPIAAASSRLADVQTLQLLEAATGYFKDALCTL